VGAEGDAASQAAPESTTPSTGDQAPRKVARCGEKSAPSIANSPISTRYRDGQTVRKNGGNI